MAEVALGTDGPNRLFRLSRYASNGRYKPEFTTRGKTGQPILEHHKEIEKRAEHLSQLLNRPVNQRATPPPSVRLAPYINGVVLPSLVDSCKQPEVGDRIVRARVQ